MTTGRSWELDAWVCGAHDEEETQTKVVFRYEPTKPWTVLVVTNLGVVERLSRDMLKEGIFEHRGLSNGILVRPDSNDTMTEIRLLAENIEGGYLYIRVSKAQLVRAMYQMQSMVRPGNEAETMDWVAGLAQCEAA